MLLPPPSLLSLLINERPLRLLLLPLLLLLLLLLLPPPLPSLLLALLQPLQPLLLPLSLPLQTDCCGRRLQAMLQCLWAARRLHLTAKKATRNRGAWTGQLGTHYWHRLSMSDAIRFLGGYSPQLPYVTAVSSDGRRSGPVRSSSHTSGSSKQLVALAEAWHKGDYLPFGCTLRMIHPVRMYPSKWMPYASSLASLFATRGRAPLSLWPLLLYTLLFLYLR